MVPTILQPLRQHQHWRTDIHYLSVCVWGCISDSTLTFRFHQSLPLAHWFYSLKVEKYILLLSVSMHIFPSPQIFSRSIKVVWEFQNAFCVFCLQGFVKAMVDFMWQFGLATVCKYLLKHHFKYCCELALTYFISSTFSKVVHLWNMSENYPISWRPETEISWERFC